ncbi:hypothetical protein HELRODRAFT_91642 [Helobdella robusta]|uniref:PDZ domain-containing protein n=1 Tax=Helobdella robusta TaxID=6412 RepID=T1G870_HELRO|nr:hypothetical protein HELRODRAFT_91642 [Helobdella robusta]ESO11163.1 hypothetical protein HELRODRAFT_91642 [Helobdella robusta]
METSLVRPDSPTQKTYNNIHLKLPQLTNHPSIKSKQRKISLKRLQTGDFGFSLRKGLTVERGANPDGSDLWKTIIFAESSTKNIIETVFKPGDQIIEINNKNVENWNRDAIIDILKKSADEVIITVRTLPEFSDFIEQMTNYANEDEKSSLSAATPTTTTNSLSSSHQQQLQQQQRQQQQQQLWLIHKKGFSACYQADDHGSANSADGKVNVKVESGQILEVNEDDLEKANPAQYDCIEDLTALRYVNETSVMHVLRQRFLTNLVCTYAGYTTLAVNSLKPLSIYSDKVKEIFRTNLTEDTPPHVYSIAQSTFKSMMTSRKDHSVVALGDSGSGKSFQLDNILNYYVATCGTVNSILNGDHHRCYL